VGTEGRLCARHGQHRRPAYPAEALPADAWTRLDRPAPYENTTGNTRTRRHNRKQEVVTQRQFVNLRLNHEDVAEFTYQPGKCRHAYRVVVLRKNISRTKGEQALIDEIRYFFYFTTYRADTHTPARLVELANERTTRAPTPPANCDRRYAISSSVNAMAENYTNGTDSVHSGRSGGDVPHRQLPGGSAATGMSACQLCAKRVRRRP